ncbi:MAG: leucine-rich repeat domain-containing protein [Microscillaceae bacterium]|nr:leucine-rich repeat domain-containing protein [Microscillaceae bacterium]MDW8459928.1 leucine-rich repeat domain-containing protein [Cytophagales bacterium]
MIKKPSSFYDCIYFLFFFCLNLSAVTAQNMLLDSVQLARQPIFKQLAQALKNPDQVYILDLSQQSLKEFPKEVLQLKRLQKLILHTNQIRTLPNEIAQLANLQFLDLYNNQINTLPQELAQLKYLTYIDLGKNRFKKFPQVLAQMPQLKYLMLYANPIKCLQANFSPDNSLHTLRLGSTKLKKFPQEITQCGQLRELYLPDNQLKKLPQNFANLSQLEHLVLENNRFRHIPEPIFELPNLKYISFWDRNFREQEVRRLQNLPTQPKVMLFKQYTGAFTSLVVEVLQGKTTMISAGLARGYVKDVISVGIAWQGHYDLQQTLWGLGARVWFNGLLHFSLGAGYYQQTELQTWAISPQVGWGIRNTSLSYGYHFWLKKKDSFTTHHITLRQIISLNPTFF